MSDPNKQKHRIIFLDIDGVLNRASTNNDHRYFVPECFREFQRIVRTTGAKVVLSTSWREFPDWEKMLHDFFGAVGIDVIGKTPVIDPMVFNPAIANRPNEIELYLGIHRDEILTYVVLDDDDMIKDFPQHCVRTCARKRIGLDEQWADEAIDILMATKTEGTVFADGMIVVIRGSMDSTNDTFWWIQEIKNGTLENPDESLCAKLMSQCVNDITKPKPEDSERELVSVCDEYNRSNGKPQAFRAFKYADITKMLKETMK